MKETQSMLDQAGRLKDMDLPEGWYIDQVADVEFGMDDKFPPHWWLVVTPDDGAMACFPTHELAFAYLTLIIFGRGGPRPARPDMGEGK